MLLNTLDPGPIEYEILGEERAEAPTIVMLHEGLGSLSLWKDFPQRLARATHNRVVAYSRHGYGRSAALDAPRTMDYMHGEALTVLPRLLDALQIERPILFGHSDGASIALIHAGASGREVAGVVALAPHIMVEDISIQGIAAAKIAYQTGGLRQRLKRHHSDVDGAFWGWNDIWLDPAFRAWNIEEYLPKITCPVLAIQGEQDEYGTMAQIDCIARAVPRVELLKLAACGHSPQRDRPEEVLQAVASWAARAAAADLHIEGQ